MNAQPESSNPLAKTVLDLLNGGGSVVVNADGTLSGTLIQFAQAAGARGSHLILKNCGKLLTGTLLEIAKAGNGRVTFDFT